MHIEINYDEKSMEDSALTLINTMIARAATRGLSKYDDRISLSSISNSTIMNRAVYRLLGKSKVQGVLDNLGMNVFVTFRYSPNHKNFVISESVDLVQDITIFVKDPESTE